MPMLSQQTVAMYNDKKDGTPFYEKVKVSDKGQLTVTLQANGGFVLLGSSN
ncbi:hypothetical protein JCM15548_11001 [Geofilum rubicundum JCM 15548]|uniref:Uncharacterized protein n=1 Tax=Geofilum rubicundum JCM 15548 TaxID=1236989 RepID=A0A0E9LUT6_9BACT|nr:hypothetical protein JCM15548_11001 [Geofilum rubicundum JCM 15548]